MAKTTSIILDDHFERFVRAQVESGRYATVSDVVRDALRRLERSKQRHEALMAALQEGLDSGVSPLSHDEVWDKVFEERAKQRGEAR